MTTTFTTFNAIDDLLITAKNEKDAMLALVLTLTIPPNLAKLSSHN